MKEYLHILKKTALFEGLRSAEILAVLDCLRARPRRYAKGETILHAGEAPVRAGLVLTGSVRVVGEDDRGNASLIAQVFPGDLFAEAFACARLPVLPMTVVAATDCSLIFVDMRRLTDACPSVCSFHTRMIRNMLAILAEKNILLNRKLRHLSQRTTREKLLSYLWEQATLCDNLHFTIPFNRQGLADYLCVDRSAMSAELSKLREEGVLEYKRSDFVLHKEA